MKRQVAFLGVIAVVTALVSACTGKAPDNGGSASESTSRSSDAPSSAASTLPFSGAPKVSNPLPAAALSGDPCGEALTSEQVKDAIGVAVQGKREDLAQTGPACSWSNRDTGGAVGVSYTVNTHVGLSGVYANTQPRSAVWKVLPDVQGFPAVAYSGSKSGGPAEGFCQESIGLADEFTIDVSLTLGSGKRGTADACSLISQIGDMAVTTVKAKAGS
jgi:hypothetical protein